MLKGADRFTITLGCDLIRCQKLSSVRLTKCFDPMDKSIGTIYAIGGTVPTDFDTKPIPCMG